MTLAAVSTALSISITLLIIVLVVISLLMILVVMMQRPKQEGLGAAFGGGMTDQLLGAGTTSFLQKATVVLGIFFFLLSLILGILVGRSNKAQGLDVKAPSAKEESAAPAPGIAEGVEIPVDEDEAKILEAIESAMETEPAGEPASETAPAEESVIEEEAAEVGAQTGALLGATIGEGNIGEAAEEGAAEEGAAEAIEPPVEEENSEE